MWTVESQETPPMRCLPSGKILQSGCVLLLPDGVLPESESVSRGQLDKLNAMNVLSGNIKTIKDKIAVRSAETANSKT